MDIKKIGPIGAEITKISLSDLRKDDIVKIKEYFLDHSVIVFRNQNLDPEDLKNIANLWGGASTHPVLGNVRA